MPHITLRNILNPHFHFSAVAESDFFIQPPSDSRRFQPYIVNSLVFKPFDKLFHYKRSVSVSSLFGNAIYINDISVHRSFEKAERHIFLYHSPAARNRLAVFIYEIVTAFFLCVQLFLFCVYFTLGVLLKQRY